MHKELINFTENLVKSLVSDPEMVKVQEFLGDDEVIQLEILVKDDDMGPLIGKGGKVASAVRVLIQAVAYNEGIHRVRVNIDSF
ncbi:MAG TPA: KH domain-containing protein [Bacilli bacterium]|jgi:predicted RNA-binding protein YlqC (UPF0109 family)|nr:KH domain-containing protein [Bacilli bacterium]HPZ23862.1 KH domain-containing protein [Bacilli bacterium]HQC83860.1 KH domain-containing protein [Bacilli bacterium]